MHTQCTDHARNVRDERAPYGLLAIPAGGWAV